MFLTFLILQVEILLMFESKFIFGSQASWGQHNKLPVLKHEFRGITVLMSGGTEFLSIFEHLLTHFGVIQPLIQWATVDNSAGVKRPAREPDH